MPFVSEAYLQYLEQQFQEASGASGTEDSLPPPATGVGPEINTTGALPPGLGGPGSYPSVPSQYYDPNWQQAQVPSTIATGAGGTGDFNAQATGLEFPGSELPVPPPPGGNVTAGGLANPPSSLGGGGAAPPGSGAVASSGGGGGGTPPATPPMTTPPPPVAGGGGGVIPGVNLSINDRINMALHNMGLPPVPTGYSPFGGLPEGFTETNRFGGGAPIFTAPGAVGPGFMAGGDVSGGRLGPHGSLTAVGTSVGLPLGASGGILPPGMANLYLHSGQMNQWAQQHGFKNVGEFLSKTGFSLAAGWPGKASGENSGAGLAGAGRAMTQAQ